VQRATPFDLASLTKPLCTALLLVMLEQEGELRLEAAAQDYLPAWKGSLYRESSLLALATHTSGMPAWLPLYLRSPAGHGYLDRIGAERPAVRPGEVLYSDLGYIVLQAVLETVTGLGLDRLFAERIARPLGLCRTGFATTNADFSDAAATERGNEFERSLAGEEGVGHDWPTELFRGVPHDGNARTLGGVGGHAGLFGTADDLAVLAREILRPRRLPLGPQARARLLCAEPGHRGRSVGMVMAARALAVRGILPDGAPGHTGFTGTSIWLEPETGAFFLLLTNRVHPRVPAKGFDRVRRGFHRSAVRNAGLAASHYNGSGAR
jgi:CubicO group peptidase (beta-lactamase class C family)